MANAQNESEVVADSLLWIDFFSRANNPFVHEMEHLLEGKRMRMAGPILCEVLIGPKKEDNRRYIQSRLCAIPLLETSSQVWFVAIELFRLPSVRIQKVPWPDVLIAAHCIFHNVALFTRDAHFDAFPTLKRHRL